MSGRGEVSARGHLRTLGNRIVDRNDRPYVLQGMALFWSQWMPQFYTADTVRWLRKDWNINAIRASLAVNYGGYRQNPEAEWRKVIDVVDAAIDLDIYAVVDWHVHEMELDSALEFFFRLSAHYGNCPNLVYEIWNEPFPRYDWTRDIKPYCEDVVPVIRANAPGSLIVVGTPTYSQRPDIAAMDRLPFDNIAYSIHFYAASHREGLRRNCRNALHLGLPVLASEYGTCEANGDGVVDSEEMEIWWRFMAENDIGHFNWSIADKPEAASALRPGASPGGAWPDDALTVSGRLVRDRLRAIAFDQRLQLADQPDKPVC